jgi:hemerythrin-like domain-containing protein
LNGKPEAEKYPPVGIVNEHQSGRYLEQQLSTALHQKSKQGT